MEIYKNGPIELRLGKWQSVLADVAECDDIITDSPYSPRTAKGYKTNPEWSKEIGSQPGVEYGSISQDQVSEVVSSWWPRCGHWFLAFGDHISARWWEQSLVDVGAYVFAPVPWIKRDGAPRFVGDGPASVAEWVVTGDHGDEPAHEQIIIGRHGHTVARGSPRRGSRPGYYMASCRQGIVTGGKDLGKMRQIVREYTLPGDLIVDPFCGGATTLLAAAIEGRRAIGAEMDPKTYALAVRRLSAGWTPGLFKETP